MKTQTELDAWLEATAWQSYYWAEVDQVSRRLKTDYCTGVLDFFAYT